MPAAQIIVICSEVIAIFLLFVLWRSGEPVVLKIPLSFLLFIPILGPILVLWITGFPGVQPKAFQDRRRYSADVFERWRHVWDEKDEAKRREAWLGVMKKDESKDF